MCLLVGKNAPEFKAQAVVGGNALELSPANAFKEISLSDYKGKWLIFFFYPLDFTFVCPTEIVQFGKLAEELKSENCEVLACSTDSHFSHLAWRSADKSLQSLPIPMLADFTRKVARDYGVLKEETGYALRGLFIIDPEGVVQYSVIHNENVGRSTAEIKRVFEGLVKGELIPCNWEPGQKTLSN